MRKAGRDTLQRQFHVRLAAGHPYVAEPDVLEDYLVPARHHDAMRPAGRVAADVDQEVSVCRAAETCAHTVDKDLHTLPALRPPPDRDLGVALQDHAIAKQPWKLHVGGRGRGGSEPRG